MISPEQRAEIRRLVLGEGLPIGTVARTLGLHHATVVRALDDDPPPPRASKPTLIEAHKPYIVERVAALPELSAIRLQAELEERGYEGGIAQLRRFLGGIRPRRPKKAYLRFEVEPGQQAQVDWGSFGHFPVDGGHRPLSCFAMVLSWSRALFIDFSLDQRMDTFLRMHDRAFAAFGGVPKTVVYDNLKSVVLHRHGPVLQLNPHFLRYAGHMIFEPKAAPVRYPEYKGRVEDAMRYIRSSFFYGRRWRNLDDLREQARRWCDDVANKRLHATTRQKPIDRLHFERKRLRGLPERAFDTDLVLPTVVRKDARVLVETNSYSVPGSHVGTPVLVRVDDKTVRVVTEKGDPVATHPRNYGKRIAVEDPAHIEEMLERRPNGREPKQKDRILALGPEARLFLEQTARGRTRIDHEVRRVLRFIERYGEDEVRVGIARCVAQGTCSSTYLRSHLDQARFEAGRGEPPEPIVTGSREADAVTVTPHALGDYDDLF